MNRLIVIAGLVVAMCASTAAGQVLLDLDASPGDQGVRERTVEPGEMVEVELLATGGATGMIGFEIEVAFDPKQVIFKGFQAGGMMTGALSMPPRTTPESVVVSTAIMGGRTLTEDAGSLGKFRFEAARSLSGDAEISVVRGSFGSQQGTRQFEADARVRLVNAQGAPAGSDGQSGFHNPPDHQPPPQGFQPPPGQGHGQGFQNPPDQGQPGGGFQNPPGRGRTGGGPQNPQGEGRPGRGFQDPPGDRGTGQGFQNPPGEGQPGRGFGNPPGPGHPGQGFEPPPGSDRPHGRPHEDGPDPATIIQELPAELQESFMSTLQTEEKSERAHIQAELTMLRSIRRTLETTKEYLSRASDDEKTRIGRVLRFFHEQGDEGPGHRPRPRRGNEGMGGGPDNMDVEQMVRRMIQEVEEEIRHLEQER